MSKSTKWTIIFITLLILVSFILGSYFYPKMPEIMVSHWGIKGEANGYMTKFWGLFLMPFISIALFLFFLLIPKIDPLAENIQKFRIYFDIFIIIIFVFLFCLNLFIIFWNLGTQLNIINLIVPALTILFFYTGILVEKAKRNWFIGIRTPWTLSNEIVWDKTHALGGKLYKVAGIISLLGLLIPNYAFFVVIGSIILISLYLIFYSYFQFQKEKNKN